MLTELCSSDWVVQLLSDGGTVLQKLAEEQMLCLGPAQKQKLLSDIHLLSRSAQPQSRRTSVCERANKRVSLMNRCYH